MFIKPDILVEGREYGNWTKYINEDKQDPNTKFFSEDGQCFVQSLRDI